MQMTHSHGNRSAKGAFRYLCKFMLADIFYIDFHFFVTVGGIINRNDENKIHTNENNKNDKNNNDNYDDSVERGG